MTEQLTPQGIPTTSFAEKAKELESVLAEKTNVEEKIAETEMAIRELLHKYEMPTDIRESDDLSGLEEKLKVYKPKEKQHVEGLVYTAARAEGRAISEIVSNPPLMKALEKKFGPKFREFFRQADDVFHMKTIDKPSELDEAKTKALKEAYLVEVRKLAKYKVQVQSSEKKINNIEKYLDFCKKIVSLAPAPQKGGGQQQQGGQKN